MTLVRFRLDLADGLSIGPGKIELLELVGREGSISAAARAMRISYRQAWMLLDSLNRGFGAPVYETATGGRRGGGARITPVGRRLVDRYRDLEKAMERLARKAVADLAPVQERGGSPHERGATPHARRATPRARGAAPHAVAPSTLPRRRLKRHAGAAARSKRRP